MQDLDLMPNADAVQASGLVLHISAAAKVNLATAQNGVAVIKDLRIENLGPDAVEGRRLRLTARPAILREKTWVIERIRRSRSAVVIFGSPKTVGHSPKARLVVTMIEVRS